MANGCLPAATSEALSASNASRDKKTSPRTSTLRGTGTITTPTTILGTLAPGNSPGTLTFTAPLTLTPGATLALDIDGTGTGTGAGNYSRVLVQGATGAQARFDIRYCLDYGTRIVAGVTPGRGGESVEGVPVFNTVAAAVAATGADASAVYVPARGVKDAVLEAVDAGIRVLACFAENVPRHDAAAAVAAARLRPHGF